LSRPPLTRYSHLLLLPLCPLYSSSFFFFNDTATTDIYTLSLHDALPILRTDPDCKPQEGITYLLMDMATPGITVRGHVHQEVGRSEEHTSELQSLTNLVCRLLLEKKKKKKKYYIRQHQTRTRDDKVYNTT